MRLFWILLSLLTLAGCEVEIGNSSCRYTYDLDDYRVEIKQVKYGGTTENVYVPYYGFHETRHYECGPAYRNVSGGTETYAYYRHGKLREHNGLTDINFEQENGKVVFYTNDKVDDLPREEGWSRTGLVYWKSWPQHRYLFDVLEIEAKGDDEFDDAAPLFALVEKGSAQKQKYYDPNYDGYVCEWNKPLVPSRKDIFCENEAQIDLTFFGRTMDIDTYIAEFDNNRKASYSTDPDHYKRQMRLRH